MGSGGGGGRHFVCVRSRPVRQSVRVWAGPVWGSRVGGWGGRVVRGGLCGALCVGSRVVVCVHVVSAGSYVMMVSGCMEGFSVVVRVWGCVCICSGICVCMCREASMWRSVLFLWGYGSGGRLFVVGCMRGEQSLDPEKTAVTLPHPHCAPLSPGAV